MLVPWGAVLQISQIDDPYGYIQSWNIFRRVRVRVRVRVGCAHIHCFLSSRLSFSFTSFLIYLKWPAGNTVKQDTYSTIFKHQQNSCTPDSASLGYHLQRGCQRDAQTHTKVKTYQERSGVCLALYVHSKNACSTPQEYPNRTGHWCH